MLRNFLLVFSAFLHAELYSLHSDVSACCSQTSSSECLRSCQMLIDQRKHSVISKRLAKFVRYCPRAENQFWTCLKNSKFWTDFRKQTQKKPSHQARMHTSCCKDAVHPSCEMQCLTTKNVTELVNENCNAVREHKFATCVNKAHALQKCCSDTKDNECQVACEQYFKKSMTTTVRKHRAILEEKCGQHSKQMQCAMNQSDYRNVMIDFTKCCSRSTTPKCEKTCIQAIHSADTNQLFSLLSADCGQFHIQTPIYQCILKTSTSVPGGAQARNDQVSKERTASFVQFKQPCCARAKSPLCRGWCIETSTNPSQMGLWDTRYLSCIQNPDEIELSSCMSDMLEPCKISSKTDEMQYCSNFNNRPFELFRRFDRFGDSSAQRLMKFWSDGLVKVMQYEFQFKDLQTCYPEKFKALACLLAIKPCSHHTPMLQVCRSDCEELLEACLDFSKTTIETTIKTTPHQICSVILPNNNQTGCLKVGDYVRRPEAYVDEKVMLPCENQPCGNNQVCIINHSYDKLKPSSKPYECIQGCPVSGKSNLVIPVRQLAKLVVEEKKQECHKVCECQIPIPPTTNPSYTVFGDCKTFACHRKRNCTVKNKEYRDGLVFVLDCNTCTCTDGQLICTKKNCGDHQRSNETNIMTSMSSPCNCVSIYNPVCGINGVTYPNACLAKCGKLKDFQLNVGDCQEVEPCNPNPCSNGLKCIPKRRVCLTPNTQCPQYTCHLPDPTGYFKITEVCELEEKSSPVCGYDGVTYKSKCLANQSGTGVDYEGPCLPEGLDKTAVKVDRCKKSKCPPVKKSNCKLFIPHGSCCPVCGSTLRVLYNEQDLVNHQNYISYSPITVVDIIEGLRQLQTVAECKLYGHLTVEGDIMFLMLVDAEVLKSIHIHACNTEAKKLQNYINNKSPIITTNYHLSILKASTLETAKWSIESASTSVSKGALDMSNLKLIICIVLAILFCR